MNFSELYFIAVGLSMDAFAIAVCTGITMPNVTLKKSATVGLYFGAFQAIMPIAGYLFAKQFADKIIAYDHWIAFGMLSVIGGKMVFESFKKESESCTDRACPDEICMDRQCPGGERPQTKEASLTPAKMLPLSIATSIDALAVGVSFAFLKVNIVSAALAIGVTTFALSTVGVKIGNVFGSKLKKSAVLAGGAILVLIGVKILLEHTGILKI